jgi:hypothetical protein
MKFRAFWDVAPCSHVEVDRRFRGTYCLHHQVIALMMEEIRTSETSVKIIVEQRMTDNIILFMVVGGCGYKTPHFLNLGAWRKRVIGSTPWPPKPPDIDPGTHCMCSRPSLRKRKIQTYVLFWSPVLFALFCVFGVYLLRSFVVHAVARMECYSYYYYILCHISLYSRHVIQFVEHYIAFTSLVVNYCTIFC